MRVSNLDRLRAGFTRIELAATLCIVFLVFGLALPALQATRTDAARMRCQDNLRKIGLGFQQFEAAHGGFPPRRTGFGDGAPYGGWGPFLLPYIGETELARKYNFKRDCFDPGNKAAVESIVSAFVCSAAPGERKVTIQAQATAKSENPNKDKVYTADCAVNDYISCNVVLMPRGGYGLNAKDTDQMGGNQRQAMADDVYLPTAKITDGLSCTLLLIEQAGRPDVWRNGKKQEGGGQFGMSANARGAWAGWGSIGFGPAGADGISAAKGDSTDCSVNCNNWFGIYGFHTGGANVLMCDGSVRFVGTKLDPLTFAYLSIRDDGHLISPNDY